jgi:hypothetical protein
VWQKYTIILKEHKEFFLLATRLAYPYTLKVEALFSAEMSVNIYQNVGHHFPGDSSLHRRNRIVGH